jgi:ribose-phosphate pyrophosphokinase
VRAAEACRAQGASAVYAAATHGVFSSKANDLLSTPALEAIVTTDSVAPRPTETSRIQDKLTILDVTALFAAAIDRIHSGGSIVDLLES